MINLLPPELKQDYAYARRNSSLVRLLSSLGFGILGLAVITGAGFLYLQQSANNYLEQAAKTETALKQQNQEKTEKEVQEISNNLKLAVQVLSEEILFSKLMQQLAVITPTKASLASVNISEFEGAMDISAWTKDYVAATQLQVNLSDPANKIFTKADIVSINCEAGTKGPNSYPCLAQYRALFADNNPFLFINGKAGS